MALKSKKYPLLFLLPALCFIAIFLIMPLCKTVYYSFTAWYNFSPTQKFIGIQNYVNLFQDRTLRNTGILIIFAMIFQIGIATLLAIGVDSVHHGFKFFRTVYFFPVIISATAIGLMFSLIYKYDYGLLNQIMVSLGKEKQIWLTAKSAIYCVAIPTCTDSLYFGAGTGG